MPEFNSLYSYDSHGELRLSLTSALRELRRLLAPYRFGLAAKSIVEEFELKEGDKILELGSGLGLLGEQIKKKIGGVGIKYYGLDLFYNSAKSGKEKGLIGLQADLVNLPFVNNSFDYVVSTDVLEHVTDSDRAAQEIYRVLKPGGKAFIVIADPSEGRFGFVKDHIQRTPQNSDVEYWEKLFKENGFMILPESNKYRARDWRRIFNLPFLVKFKDKPVLACAFNPVNRPGVYILQKKEEAVDLV